MTGELLLESVVADVTADVAVAVDTSAELARVFRGYCAEHRDASFDVVYRAFVRDRYNNGNNVEFDDALLSRLITVFEQERADRN